MHQPSDSRPQVNDELRAELLTLAERVAGVGHWLFDLKDESVFWSNEVYQIHGVTPDTFSPDLQSTIDFCHPDDVDSVRNAIAKAIDTGKSFEFECRLVRDDGEVRVVHSRSNVRKGDNGESTAVFGILQDITDRRAIEADLLEINERYHAAIQGSGVGLWDRNLRNQTVYWSPRYLEILGIDDPDFNPSDEEFWSRLHPDDRKAVRLQTEMHRSGQKNYDIEYRLLHSDGDYRWIHATGLAVWNGAGEALRMSGSIIDITERKNDEIMRENVSQLLTTENSTSQQQIAKLLNIGRLYLGLDLAIVSRIQDEDYSVEYVDDPKGSLKPGTRFQLGETYCAITVANFGVTAYSNAGKSDISNHPCYLNMGLESYIGVSLLENGKPVGTVNFSAAAKREKPFGNRERSFVAMLAKWISYEIRQQKALEEVTLSHELVAQKERELDLVFNTVPVRIWYKDDKNRILRLNSPAAESMGMSVTDAEGADTYDLFPAMAKKYHTDDLAVINSGKALLNIVEEYTPRDGELGWVRTDKVPFIEPSTGERHIVVVSQDITEQMRTQAELREQTRQLQQTNKDLDDFAYVASHDLRAPLNGIANLTEWIEEDLAENVSEETRENLNLLRSRVKRIDHMLGDILDYSRAGRSTNEHEAVDCNALLAEVVSWVQTKHFEIAVEPKLPTLFTARTSLQQVFSNLLSNAIRHHDKDRGMVSVGCTVDATHATFQVIDDGPGIPKEYRKKIFKMFETLERRDDVDGTGIGLAIVERIVHSLGGTISVHSNKEKRGSEFRFRILLAPTTT